MKIKKILFVVAHPDDEVLGCGVIIKKFISQGLQIKIIILGEGSSCRFKKIEKKGGFRTY